MVDRTFDRQFGEIFNELYELDDKCYRSSDALKILRKICSYQNMTDSGMLDILQYDINKYITLLKNEISKLVEKELSNKKYIDNLNNNIDNFNTKIAEFNNNHLCINIAPIKYLYQYIANTISKNKYIFAAAACAGITTAIILGARDGLFGSNIIAADTINSDGYSGDNIAVEKGFIFTKLIVDTRRGISNPNVTAIVMNRNVSYYFRPIVFKYTSAPHPQISNDTAENTTEKTTENTDLAPPYPANENANEICLLKNAPKKIYLKYSGKYVECGCGNNHQHDIIYKSIKVLGGEYHINNQYIDGINWLLNKNPINYLLFNKYKSCQYFTVGFSGVIIGNYIGRKI